MIITCSRKISNKQVGHEEEYKTKKDGDVKILLQTLVEHKTKKTPKQLSQELLQQIATSSTAQ